MKKINIHFFILFFLTLDVIISDFVIYFLKTNFIITNAFNGILLLFITVFLYKKQKIKFESNTSKSDLLFLIPFAIYFIFTVVFPDLSWDTRSYHIYIQENVFKDKINMDFFAGRNLNTFLFALGDRINYLFRYCLGYRLGTIISYYLITVLYYQIKRILGNMMEKKKPIIISFFSILPVLSSIVFSYTGTYYIDNYSLIFLMEIFIIVLFEDDILKDKVKFYFLGLLIGFSISIKITNIVFLILLGCYCIFRNLNYLKNLKIYNYVIFIIFLISPIIIYGIDNYIQTKNPVFPYYNNIFKSPFFMEEAWKDGNFGPLNICQFLFWPIYIVFNPNRAFDTKFVDLGWAFGFLSIFGYIIYSIITKNVKNNKLFSLSLIIFLNYYLWEKFLIGYVRYATILLVLSLIVTVIIIEKILYKNLKCGIIIFSIFIVITIPSLGYNCLVKVKNYNSVNNFLEEYRGNLKRIVKDKKTDKIEVNGLLGAIGDDSLLPTLLNENNVIFNLEEWVTITNETTRKMYADKILNRIIYVPIDDLTKERKLDYLERNNFEIINVEKMNGEYNFLSPSDELYLYKVRKNVLNN